MWSEGLPTAIYSATELREIAPRIWFPDHASYVVFETMGESDLSAGRLLVRQRAEYRTQNVTLNPHMPAERFNEPVVPAGTEVAVEDETGRVLGKYTQENAGPPTISREKHQELFDEANNRRKKQGKGF
jgi:hypothetical protein